jgi:hypothetical protein
MKAEGWRMKDESQNIISVFSSFIPHPSKGGKRGRRATLAGTGQAACVA